MHRKKALTLLESYIPSSEEEESKERIISFMRKYPNCFERSLEIGHMTASAWLLNRAGTHALLMHHRKLNIWLQPGGHCDGETDLLAVAIKEAQEESGIMQIEPVMDGIFDIDVHAIPKHKDVPAHIHYDVRFLLQVRGDDTLHQNGESNELKWFDADPTHWPTKERSVIRMFEKWAHIKAYFSSKTQSGQLEA